MMIISDAQPASRVRVIDIQRPNPTTYRSGRWKVKEIYVVELKEENKRDKPKSVQSVTSNDSIGRYLLTQLEHSIRVM